MAAEDAVAAENIRVAAAAVAVTVATIPTKAIKEDLPKATEDNTTIKGLHSIATIKGITIKVVTKAFKASTTNKDPLNAKAAEVESVSTPEGGTISTTLKWMLGPLRVPITR